MQRRELEALGVAAHAPRGAALSGDALMFLAFDVGEEHPQWAKLRFLFEQWNVSDVLTTEFSKGEIEAAEWLDLVPEWHHGYPQPDELNFGYLRATYDLTEWCDSCGIGMKQKAPFQFKSEPRWGRRAILQLNWVFDEYFVTPHVWSTILRPHGIGCRAVTDRRGTELRTVVQLVIDDEVEIATDGLDFERCTKCRRVKYLPVVRGPFPALATESNRSMMKTTAYFGSGVAAYQHVLISRSLAQSLIDQKTRGVSFWPASSEKRGS